MLSGLNDKHRSGLMTIANSSNDTSRKLSDAGYKRRAFGLKKYAGWYEDYLKHPEAQYKMTFSEYKKNRIKTERKRKSKK